MPGMLLLQRRGGLGAAGSRRMSVLQRNQVQRVAAAQGGVVVPDAAQEVVRVPVAGERQKAEVGCPTAGVWAARIRGAGAIARTSPAEWGSDAASARWAAGLPWAGITRAAIDSAGIRRAAERKSPPFPSRKSLSLGEIS
jgi:hypothetical protein